MHKTLCTDRVHSLVSCAPSSVAPDGGTEAGVFDTAEYKVRVTTECIAYDKKWTKAAFTKFNAALTEV